MALCSAAAGMQLAEPMAPPGSWAQLGPSSRPCPLSRLLYAEHELHTHKPALAFTDHPCLQPTLHFYPPGDILRAFFLGDVLPSGAGQQSPTSTRRKTGLFPSRDGCALGLGLGSGFFAPCALARVFRGPASWPEALWAASDLPIRSSRHFSSFSFCFWFSGRSALLPSLPLLTPGEMSLCFQAKMPELDSLSWLM